jgi:glycine reductase complex component B subunit gamma
MAGPFRVVHYVNQFFAGIGGEEQAGVGPALQPGPLGPGLRLQQLLGADATMVATAWSGDNYFADHEGEATAALLEAIGGQRPDLVVLGPAFNAGRYGVACARLGAAVARELGVPAIGGMHAENPGLDVAREEWSKISIAAPEPIGGATLAGGAAVAGTRGVDTAAARAEAPFLVVRTDADARGMGAALERMVGLARALWRGTLPPAAEGGYFPRGIRLNVRKPVPAAERAVEMLVAKLRGEPVQTELAPPRGERVAPAPPVPALAGATVALVTDGGLVPRGNPDGLPAGNALRYAALDVSALERFDRAAYEAYHRGYDTTLASADPNRLVPLDAARELERAGRFGRLLPYVYTTAGCSAPVANARQIGREIAAELQAQRVDAAIVTST